MSVIVYLRIAVLIHGVISPLSGPGPVSHVQSEKVSFFCCLFPTSKNIGRLGRSELVNSLPGDKTTTV